MAEQAQRVSRRGAREAVEEHGRGPEGSGGSSLVPPVLLILFAGGGCAALIYEVVWLQLLQLVIGLTGVSQGLLLGMFMGGMCLGSLILPRWIHGRENPLRVYAVLELGIGVCGLLVLWLMPWISRVYIGSVGSGVPGIMLRGLVAAVCLLPPTVLMGATLPAISRWVETTREGVSWLGFLYGGNIAGAVFGCLLAGFYLLRVHDAAVATYVAASVNGAVALLAFGLSLVVKHSPAPGAKPEAAAGAFAAASRLAEASDGRTGRGLIYAAIALSGMSALGAEVVWTRLLSLTLGGTVYTFSIILCVFLVGLGLGSGAGAYLARTGSGAGKWLCWCQALLVAGIAWAAYGIACSLPYWPVNPTLSLSPWFTFQIDAARCVWAVLPGAILWGASFPLALAAVARKGEDTGRLVGRVYAANTVGAIAGALAFSLVLVPWLGTQWAEKVLIGLPALAVVVLCLGGAEGAVESAGPRLALGLATVLLVAFFAAWNLPASPWGLIAYGRYHATYASRLVPGVVTEKDVAAATGAKDVFCLYYGEGLNGSVAVTQWKSGVRNFHSAGKVQASNGAQDMRLQRMLGHLSALAVKKPESVLVVACGAGVTAGSFVKHPEVKRIVICDIEPLVPKHVAPMFKEENFSVITDPRTQVVLDDGRHFIETTQEKFDVITSDPIDPWVKGCAALNTVEYYEMCKRRLKPGGVMSLWIPLYESSVEGAKSAISTFFKVFPRGILWSNDSRGEGYDAVLFGQAEPSRFDLDELQDRLNQADHEPVRKSLESVGFKSGVGLLATYAGQAEDLGDWMRDAHINTDRNMRLQYLAGMGVNSYLGSEILAGIMKYRKFPEELFPGSSQRQAMLRTMIEHRGDTVETEAFGAPEN